LSKTTTTKQEAAPWKPAQGNLQDVLSQSRDLYQSGGYQTEPYQGQRVADFSQATKQGMQGLMAPSAITGQAEQAFGGFMDDSARSRAFDQMKATTIADTKAALGSTLAGGGLNTGLGGEMFGRGLGEAIGGIEYGAWGDAQNRKLSAMGMAPQIAGLGRADTAGMLQAGGMQDIRNQKVIGADVAKYYEGQGAQANALDRYANLSGMMGGMGGTSSGSSTEPWSLDDVGSAASGIGGAMKFFSDRRLKENVMKVGETLGGTNVYSYNYKGGTHRHIGPMADEVPGAIIGTINGYSVVDYGKVE